jgi:hypothetical protein
MPLRFEDGKYKKFSATVSTDYGPFDIINLWIKSFLRMVMYDEILWVKW